MKAYIFPGQGSQFPGMARDLFEQFDIAKQRFSRAAEILGFDISKIMFEGTEEELKQTRVTQPAIFLHSVILAECYADKFSPEMVAGHSLGEFSALVGNKTLDFETGLALVAKRANAMQKACELNPSTMAAVLNLPDEKVEDICSQIHQETGEIVVAANYNCPGQLVISGTKKGIEIGCEKMKAAGAKRALVLPVGGAFHSPLMEPARKELEDAINKASFNQPICPVFQNVTASAETNPDSIKKNLIAQLTGPVKWTQTVQAMVAAGGKTFIEVGPGKVLQGLVKKVSPEVEAGSLQA